jgi:hypothetical protein
MLEQLEKDWGQEWVSWICDPGNPPPATVHEALGQEPWLDLLVWHARNGDFPIHLASLVLLTQPPEERADVWPLYRDAGWPQRVQDGMEELAVQPADWTEDDYRDVLSQWSIAIEAHAETAYELFVVEIEQAVPPAVEAAAVEAAAVEDAPAVPSAVVAAPSGPPMGTAEVDKYKQWNKEILDHAGAGEDVFFLQLDEWVLLLNHQVEAPPELKDPLEGSGATWGRIRVESRGSLTSRGRLTVFGAPDEAEFKTTIRQITQKELRFRPSGATR